MAAVDVPTKPTRQPIDSDRTKAATRGATTAAAIGTRPDTLATSRPLSDFVASETRRLSSTAGMRFVADCVSGLVTHQHLDNAAIVLYDDGRRYVFFRDNQPISSAWDVAVASHAPAGVHTDPMLADSVSDLDALARLCGVALRLELLAHHSLHDELTGLYNRRAFDEMLSGAVSQAQRYGWQFTLVLLDMDKLKTINDSLGHPVGDAVLQTVGVSLRSRLRTGDIAARLGGDEFAMILPASTGAGVPPVMARLQVDVDAHGVNDVWLSVGRATCPDEAADVDSLYRLADERLYDDKRSRPQSRSQDPT